jgi:hypothetical protein
MVTEIELHESEDTTLLHFGLRAWVKERIAQKEGGYNRRIGGSRLLMLRLA